MKDLIQLGNNIKYLNDNYSRIIDVFIKSFEPDFIDIVQDQLRRGYDGDGDRLAEYRSNSYAKFKKALGSISSPIADLYAEGDFYDGMTMKGFDIISTDSKSAALQNKYGTAILDPDESTLDKFMIDQMIPEFEALIEKIIMKGL